MTGLESLYPGSYQPRGDLGDLRSMMMLAQYYPSLYRMKGLEPLHIDPFKGLPINVPKPPEKELNMEEWLLNLLKRRG
jgi:hypothetical protein